LEQGFREDHVRWNGRVAIGEAHIGVPEHPDGAAAVDAARFHQHVGRLAAVGAGVHAQGAADGARDAPEECQTVDAGIRRRAGDLHVRYGGSGAETVPVLDTDRAKSLAAEPDDDARDAGVADDEVRAEADDRHCHVVRQGREEIGEVFLVRRREQDLRRAAGSEPCEVRERHIGQEAAAQLRHARLKISGDVGETRRGLRLRRDSHHAAFSPRTFSSPGSA
jgi:hypothetical protein